MHFTINHHYHYGGDMERKLNQILKQNNSIMNKQERFDAFLQRLDATTNDIAADYKKLLEEVQNGNVSDESLAKAEANIAKLEEIGSQVDSSPADEAPDTEEDESEPEDEEQ